ncbi:hypothetical protein [Microcoleus sp. AT3-D2]|uniref:hypothetical protein n=1 Tax=Microcoleus sp. AT3-D2 TaxID=2818612 RepID=UPI002FD1F661
MAFVPIVRRGFLTAGGLGGITAIRSHLGALRQFDRTWGHYGYSIAQFRFDCTDTLNHNSIALSTF